MFTKVRKNKIPTILAITLVMLLAFGGSLASFASATTNPTMTEETGPAPEANELPLPQGCDSLTRYKIDESPDTKEYSDGTLTVDITVYDNYLSWVSKSPDVNIHYVYVKGGQDQAAHLYTYGSALQADSGLTANIKNGQPQSISHLAFYYCENDHTTTTQTGTLRVAKVVQGSEPENTNETFNITITPDDTEANPIPGQVTAGSYTDYTLAPGWYTVSENTSSLPSNYSFVGLNPTDGRIQIVANQIATVTITNNYTEPGDNNTTPETGILRVVKVLQGLGSSTQPFYITITPGGEEADPIHGQVTAAVYTDFTLAPGWYTVSENTSSLPPNYSFVGLNPQGGVIEVLAGQTVTVTITNSYTTQSNNGYTPPTIVTVINPPAGGETEIEVPADPAGNGEGEPEGDGETMIEVPADPAGSGTELPRTSGTDILLLGLGAVVASGGLMIRRRKRK